MTRESFGKRTARVAALFATAAASVLVASGTLGSASAQEPQRGGTLHFARDAEPLSLTPGDVADNGSIWAVEQICDSLLEPDETGRGIRPALAESYEVSDDGLVYTFKLRDAKFSNGEPVTMEDVLFTLDTITAPDAYNSYLYPPMEYSAADESTLRVELEKPFTPFLSIMSVYAAAIMEKAAFEADSEAFSAKPVCAGAFKVDSFDRGSKLVLSPNEHYWDRRDDGGPAPYVDKIEMLYVPETNARMVGLWNRDYDIISLVPLSQAASLEQADGVVLEVAPAFRLDYVYLNHEAAPLDNRDVRLAMNYAANREAILGLAYFGYGEIPNSYMPKINYHCESVEPIPFDVEKAKELVEGSGYDGTPIEIMVDTGNSTFRQIATMLQQGWQQAGLNVEITEYDVGTAWSKTETGDYQAYVSYITSDTNDQDFLASIQADYTGNTEAFFSHYKNDQVVEWLQQAQQALEPERRQELYCQILEQVYHDGYSVPLNFRPFVNAHLDTVHGFHNLVTGPWWLKDVWLEQDN